MNKKITAYILVAIMLISAMAGLASIQGNTPLSNAQAPAASSSVINHSNLTTPYYFQVAGSFAVGANPWGAAYDSSNGYIYITNYGSDNVSVINGSTNALVTTISTTSGAKGIIYDPSNNYVYVSEYGNSYIGVINTSTNDLTQIGSSNPTGLTYDSSNGYVYAAGGSGDVYAYNSTSNVATISVGSASSPYGIVYDPSNNYLYVADSASDQVSVINASDNTFLTNITVSENPRLMAYDSSNGYVYVGDYYAGNVTIINGTTVKSNISFGTAYTPTGITYDPANGYIYVNIRTQGQVKVINGTTAMATIAVGSHPWSSVYDPLNGYVYVDNRGSGSVSYIGEVPSVTNQNNVAVGATYSGLNVTSSMLGYSGKNGSNVSDAGVSLTVLGSDGSVYGYVGDTLVVNETTTLDNVFIPGNLQIKSGAILTIGSNSTNTILNQHDSGTGLNNYTAGQLIIIHTKIHNSGSAGSPLLARIYNSITYSDDIVNITNGQYDTFSFNTTLEVSGEVSFSHFSYNNLTSSEYLHVYAGKNALITDSYLEGVNSYLNNNSNLMNIQYSTVSFNSTYVKSDAYGNAQLPEQNVNMSYVVFTAYGVPSYEGVMLFDYSQYYNDYANFTIPEADWGNTSVIADALTAQGYGNESYNYRGSTNLNDTLYPVSMVHNDFSGLDGFELYGTGHSYIENNLIGEQFFWTAYVDTFNQYSEPLKNSIFSNNTFTFYGNSTLEDSIDSDIGEGGGNTYMTSGEAGNLMGNVTLEYNTFQGILGDVTENSDQHASFLLGAYSSVEYNYFNVTGTFNSGASIKDPENAIELYQVSGNSNMSYNKIAGLNSDAMALALVPVKSATSYGTLDLYANEYNSTYTAYQITAYSNYTLNAIHATNYQYIEANGTAALLSGNSPSGYTADVYEATNTPHYYTITLNESGLPSGTSWEFKFNNVNYTLTNTSYVLSEPNGNYGLYVYNVSGYLLKSYNTTIVVNNANVTENITFLSEGVTVISSQNPTDVGNNVTFTATVKNITSPDYKWYKSGVLTNVTTSNYTTSFNASGSYVVGVEVYNNNVTVYYNYTETVNADPTVTVTTGYKDIGLNYYDTFAITVNGGTAPFTYSWHVNGVLISNTTSTMEYEFNATGNYTIEGSIIDNASRSASNTVTVSVTSISIQMFYNTTSQQIDKSVTLSAVVSGGSGGYTYLWSNGNTTNETVFTFTSLGVNHAYLNVTDSEGATAQAVYSVYIYPISVDLFFTNVTTVILNGTSITLNNGYYNFTTSSYTYTLNETSTGYIPVKSTETLANTYSRTLSYGGNTTITIYEVKAYYIEFYASGFDKDYNISLDAFNYYVKAQTSYAYFNASYSGTATINGSDFLFTSLPVSTNNTYYLTVENSTSPTIKISTNASDLTITDKSTYGTLTFTGVSANYVFTGYYGYNNTVTVSAKGYVGATKTVKLTASTTLTFTLGLTTGVVDLYFQYNGTSAALAKSTLDISIGGVPETSSFVETGGNTVAEIVLNISVGYYAYSINAPTYMDGWNYSIAVTGTFDFKSLNSNTYYLNAVPLRNVVFFTNMGNNVTFTIQASNGQSQKYTLANDSVITLPLGTYSIIPDKIAGYEANPQIFKLTTNTLEFNVDYVKSVSPYSGVSNYFKPYLDIFSIIISLLVGILVAWKLNYLIGFFTADIVLLLFYLIKWANTATFVIFIMFSLAVIIYGLFLRSDLE